MSAGSLASAPVLVLGGELFRSVLIFLGATALAWLCARLAPSSNLKKWALFLPMLKVTWDLAREIPNDAYVKSAFAGQFWELGRYGLLLESHAPFVVVSFSGRLWVRQAETWYALSGGDLVTHALVVRGLFWLLAGLLGLASLLSAARVARRIRDWIRSRREEREARSRARLVGELSVFGRRVPLLESADGQRGPHATGVFSPAIWLPTRLLEGPAEQLNAVVEHELAHLRHADVLLFSAVTVFGDVFWFLPGRRALERRLRAAAEEAADTGAVSRGAAPGALARSILAEAEFNVAARGLPALGGSSFVLARVERLLDARKRMHPVLRSLRFVAMTYVVAVLSMSGFWGYR